MNNEKQTTALPKNMLYNSGLKSTELIVYTYFVKELFFKSISKKYFKLSPTHIAKKLNISKPTVMAAIKSLKEKNLINIEEKKVYYISKSDNRIESFEDFTFYGFEEGCLVKSEFGGYVEVPDAILYDSVLTASEKTAWIKIKSINFNGMKKIHISGIATISKTPLNTFEKQVRSLREKGYLSYCVKRNSNKQNDTEIVNLKLLEEREEEKEEMIETNIVVKGGEELDFRQLLAASTEEDFYLPIGKKPTGKPHNENIAFGRRANTEEELTEEEINERVDRVLASMLSKMEPNPPEETEDDDEHLSKEEIERRAEYIMSRLR